MKKCLSTVRALDQTDFFLKKVRTRKVQIRLEEVFSVPSFQKKKKYLKKNRDEDEGLCLALNNKKTWPAFALHRLGFV